MSEEKISPDGKRAVVKVAKRLAETTLQGMGEGDRADMEEPTEVVLKDGRTLLLSPKGHVADLGVDETIQN